MKMLLAAAAIAAATIAPAFAYTSYLKPDEHWVSDDDVVVEGAFASQFFTPAVAVPARLSVTDPTGAEQPFRSVAINGPSTRLESALTAEGTYRISTGENLGQVTTLMGVDGQWRPLAQGETPPEGAPLTTIQTVSLANVYVTRGAPNRTAVDRPDGRLAIRPITHPNQVLVANGFDVEVLFDGQPLANTAVVLYGAGDPDTRIDRYFATGADGHARITVDAPGEYVIAARNRADVAGGEAAVRSYTTTVTFEALAALPPIRQIHPEDEHTRRRMRRYN